MSWPVGPAVSTTPAPPLPRVSLKGGHTTLVPLEPRHAEPSFAHLAGPDVVLPWTYMFGGPYPTLESWQAAVDAWSKTTDPLCYAVVLPSGEGGKGGETVVGLMSFMNIVPDHRRLEIGSIIFGDALKRTRAATEAFYLTMRHAFDDLGYARFEWKANHLNAPSLAAADRLGFTFEGTFRRHMIIKGHSRDTAWYSITEEEWPLVKRALEAWLDDGNFDTSGKQIKGLRELREAFKVNTS